MITINTILDMRPGAVPKIIHLSQYDSDFSLVFRLHASFGTLNIESGTTAEIRGTKKSGTGYSASATLNTTNNTVTVAGDAQMTAVAGQNIYEIVLIKNNKVLGSANFILLVERAALDADTITDATVLRELNAIIEGAETATQAAEEAEGAADRAEAAAQTFVVDDTLTQIGQPADAKATGDKLSAISGIDTLYVFTPLTYSPVAMERTRQGIRFVQGANGTVQASGTNDGTGASLWGMQDADGIHYFSLSASKTYRLTGCPSGGGANKYDINIRTATSGTLFADEGNGVVFSPESDGLYQIVVTVRKDYVISGTMTFSPKLEVLTETEDELTAVDSFARNGYGLFNNTIVTPQMFGAVANGTIDDSNAVIAADSFGAETVFFPPGKYNLSGVTATKSWIMADGAWITTTTANGVPVTISGSGNTYKLNLDFTNINPYWGVDITGDNNHIEQLIVHNQVYNGNTQPYGSAALMVHGDNNTVDFAKFMNMTQSHAGNDSAPQCIATLNDATGNYFANIQAYNCRSGFVNASGAGSINSIGSIVIKEGHDNAVYNVRGGHMDIGVIDHDGDDEGFVVITDSGDHKSSANVGKLFCRGCPVGIRIKNAGIVNIDDAVLTDCALGIRLDLNNVESEALNIQNLHIRGSMQKAMYISADGLRGELDYLRIGNLYIDHESAKTGAQATDLQTYIDVSAVNELYIEKCDMRFTAEDNIYENTTPKMVLNSTPSIRSFVGRCRIFSNHDLMITPVGQSLMTITNGLLDNGGVTIDGSGAYDNGIYAASAPQSGVWQKGQIIYSTESSDAEYRCVTSGSPGTWKTITYSGD